MRRRVWFASLVLLLTIGACGPTGGVTTPPPGGSSLRIVVDGLPSGTDANVLVAGPAGYSTNVTATTTLTGLEGGEYEVLASHAQDASGAVYASEPAFVTASVSASSSARVDVTYEADPIEISADTAVLSEATLSLIGGFTPASTAGLATAQSSDLPPLQPAAHGSLVFSSDAAELQDLKVGDILALDAQEHLPYGALGRVTSISRSAGQVIVELATARLDEAIESGSAYVESSFEDIADVDYLDGAVPGSLSTQASGTPCLALAKELKDGEGGSATFGGELCFELDFDFSVRFGRFLADPEVQLVSEFTPSLTLSAELKLQLAEYDSKFIPLAVFTHTAVTVPAGPVPLVFVPRTLIGIQVEAGVATAVSVGFTGSATVTSGVLFSNDYPSGKPIGGITFDYETDPPSVAIEADAKVSAGAQTDFLLYGVTGGLARALAYLRLGTELTEEELAWGLYTGFDVSVGFKFTLLSLKAEATVDIVTVESTLLEGAIPIEDPTAPNAVPVINSFAATPSIVAVGEAVTFTWTVSDSDGDPIACSLDVDADGTSDYTIEDCVSDVSQTHVYSTSDSYQPVLHASDGRSGSATARTGVTVASDGDPADGLLVHYTFDDCSATDASGNGHDGSLPASSTCPAGPVGLAADLANEGFLVTIPDLPTGSAARSVSSWVRLDSGATTNTDQSIAGWGGGSYGEGFVLRYGLGGSYTYGVWLVGCDRDVIVGGGDCEGGTPGGVAGTWHHLVAVYDTASSTAILYLDGVEAARRVVSIDTALSRFGVGVDDTYRPATLDGAVDDVRAYSRVLAPEEVAALYRLGDVGGL